MPLIFGGFKKDKLIHFYRQMSKQIFSFQSNYEIQLNPVRGSKQNIEDFFEHE